MEDVSKRRRIFLSRFKLKFVPQEINSWKMTVERVCLFHGLLFQLMPGPFYAPPIAAIKSKQFENYLSEMKASCNTKATDHAGPKLENNCRFFGSKAKSSAVDGKTKVVKQAQKFQGEAIFFFFSIVPKNAERYGERGQDCQSQSQVWLTHSGLTTTQ